MHMHALGYSASVSYNLSSQWQIGGFTFQQDMHDGLSQLY